MLCVKIGGEQQKTTLKDFPLVWSLLAMPTESCKRMVDAVWNYRKDFKEI